MQRFTFQPTGKHVESSLWLEGWDHVTCQADSCKHEILVRTTHFVFSHISCRSRRRTASEPGSPSLGLGEHTILFQIANPFFIANVRHTCISVTIVDEDAQLLHEFWIKCDRSWTRRVI